MPLAAIFGTVLGGFGSYRQAQAQKQAQRVYASAAERDAKLAAGYKSDITRTVAIGAGVGAMAALLFGLVMD